MKNDAVDFAARSSLEDVLAKAMSNPATTVMEKPVVAEKSEKVMVVGTQLTVKTVLAATIFVILVSGMTALAVTSTYCAVFMR